MSASQVNAADVPAERTFFPTSVLKCIGPAVFRSQAMRDAACLFDVDMAVKSWTCNADELLLEDGELYTPDFKVQTSAGETFFHDVDDRRDLAAADVLIAAAAVIGADYSVLEQELFRGSFRLRNAHDLLRYGNYRVPLGDRVLVMRMLDEHGSLSLHDCLSVFREGRPMACLASMLFGGFIEIDLDGALIGPDTEVRLIRA